jgi:hypothetical protein
LRYILEKEFDLIDSCSKSFSLSDQEQPNPVCSIRKKKECPSDTEHCSTITVPFIRVCGPKPDGCGPITESYIVIVDALNELCDQPEELFDITLLADLLKRLAALIRLPTCQKKLSS